MVTIRVCSPALIAAVCILAAPTSAGANPDDPGIHSPFFRITPGVSYGWALNGGAHEVGADFSVALGALVSPTLAVHFTGLGSAMHGVAWREPQPGPDLPRFPFVPHEVPNDDGTHNGVHYYGIGLGITRVAPEGASWWSLSVVVGEMGDGSTGFRGPGIEALTGKEWPAGDRVGFGIALGCMAYLAMVPSFNDIFAISPSLRVTMTAR